MMWKIIVDVPEKCWNGKTGEVCQFKHGSSNCSIFPKAKLEIELDGRLGDAVYSVQPCQKCLKARHKFCEMQKSACLAEEEWL